MIKTSYASLLKYIKSISRLPKLNIPILFVFCDSYCIIKVRNYTLVVFLRAIYATGGI